MNKTIEINEKYVLLDTELGSISGLSRIKKSEKNYKNKGFDLTFIIQKVKGNILHYKLYGMQTQNL